MERQTKQKQSQMKLRQNQGKVVRAQTTSNKITGRDFLHLVSKNILCPILSAGWLADPPTKPTGSHLVVWLARRTSSDVGTDSSAGQKQNITLYY